MLIEGNSYLVEVFFYTDQVGVKSLLEDEVDGAVPHLAVDLPDEEVDPLEGFLIPVALEPLEMELKPADRIEDGAGEIRAQNDLFHHVVGFKAATVGLEIVFESRNGKQQIFPVRGIGPGKIQLQITEPDVKDIRRLDTPFDELADIKKSIAFPLAIVISVMP